MLQEMRKYAKSTVASIFLGLLALSFGVWGIADIFRGNTDTTVAVVGDSKISFDTFQREYQNYIRSAATQSGKIITPEEARAKGLGEQILQRLISRQAVDNVVAELKLTASDTAVSRQIRDIRAFSGPLGTFDHDTFMRQISQSGFTEDSFIAAVRDDTAREQLLGATNGGIEMPAGYAQALFDYLNEERAVQFVALPASDVSVSPPDDKTLAAYVKAHENGFSTPEYREATYVAMTPADVMSQVSVTDDQLKQEYEVRKADYQIPEKRDIEQITFPDEASAKAAHDKIAAGKSFDAIAKERGLKTSDIALGSVVEDDLGKDRGPAAFALPVGGISQPVKGIFGYVLLHVTKITPGSNKTFDDVKEDLRKDVMQQLALAKLTDVTNAFEDAQAGGANITEAARKVGMHAVHVAAVDARGFAPDGTKAAVPGEPEFIAQLFKAEEGEDGDPFQTKDGNVYIIKVDGVTPPKLKPLDQVRDAAAAAYMTAERAKLLAAKAKALAATANKQQSIAGVAGQIGAAVQASGILTRGNPVDPFPPALIDEIFKAPPGQTVFGPAAKGDAYILARITGIAHPPVPPVDDPRYKQFVAQLSNQLGGDIPNSFAMAVRAKQGVNVNQQMVERVTGSGS